MGYGWVMGGLWVGPGYGYPVQDSSDSQSTKGILLINAYDHIRVAGLFSNFIIAFLRRQNCQPDPFRR